jgi:hypothetical protein
MWDKNIKLLSYKQFTAYEYVKLNVLKMQANKDFCNSVSGLSDYITNNILGI